MGIYYCCMHHCCNNRKLWSEYKSKPNENSTFFGFNES